MNDVTRTYRQLKSVRAQMKKCLKKLQARSITEHATEIGELEEATRDLAEKKTVLRKRFERLAKRKGPYRIS